MAKVQVIMTSFNRPVLVQKAIQSVIEQFLKDWTLLIMDNSSENVYPRMHEIYQSYGKVDSRIKSDHTVVPNERRYSEWWPDIVVRKALFGPLRSDEPYVVFTTDDDLMTANKLGTLSTFMDAHAEVGCTSGIMEILDDQGNVLNRLGGGSYDCGSCMIDWAQPMWRRTILDRAYPRNGMKEYGMGCMDITLFNLAVPYTRVYGLPVVLDRQFRRNRDTWVTASWRERAIRGDLME